MSFEVGVVRFAFLEKLLAVNHRPHKNNFFLLRVLRYVTSGILLHGSLFLCMVKKGGGIL